MNSRFASGSRHSRILTVALWLLLAASITKLWLVQLPSSFWVDEMVTAFVVAHPGDPSFADAPQVPQSIYYALPQVAQKWFGTSEIAYRIPSELAMAMALLLIGWLAARLLHPQAAWFVVFTCFGLRGINYHAGDARPYALGIAVAAAALCFLVRWLDAAHWLDAAAFVLFASLLWHVHLIYWPFYLVFAIYPLVRLLTHETSVKWTHALAVFGVLAVTLIPVAISAIKLQRAAGAHVITEVPDFRSFEHEIRWTFVAICGGSAWLVGRLLGWLRQKPVSRSSLTLIAAWWLGQPLVLFLYSHVTGNSVFIGRYVSIAVPGTALAATAVAASFIPANRWRVAALALGIGVLAVAGQWQTRWPRHDNSDWRAASQEVNRLSLGKETPVIVPSPFVEARSPVWTPDYHLPGFLYSHLPFYPLKGKIYLFPFEKKDGQEYARQLTAGTLSSTGRFLIYGGDRNVKYWTGWFAAQPELTGWTNRIEKFGDVEVGVLMKNATADVGGTPVSLLKLESTE